MKKKPTIVGIVLLILSLLIWFFCLSTSTNSSLNDYAKRRIGYTSASYVLPELDSLPDYEGIYYQYRHKRMVLFSADSLLLVITYDKETYIAEKKKLEQYSFLDHIVGYDETYFIPEHKFSINSFTFRVLDQVDDKFFYPKRFGMIATSDEKNSIAYMYFDDIDLDFISENTIKGRMERFVKEYYRYKW